MTIKCLIIDDKPLAVDILTAYLHKVPFLELIGATTNPIEGLSIIQAQQVDLVFLDIQMPELTGLQFMSIAGPKLKVVLTTAYATYAIDGFEYDVIDYLLKPVSFDRFYRAANKAFAFFNKEPAILPQPDNKIERSGNYLFVKMENRIRKVDFKDIRYIESLQNYIVIYMETDKVISLQPLKRIEEQLPETDFVRVHKSYIVGLSHISSIERNRIYIGQAIIPIGDSYKERFRCRIHI